MGRAARNDRLWHGPPALGPASETQIVRLRRHKGLMETSTTWSVDLTGHAFDLEDLPVFLSGGPVRVVRGERGWQLVSEEFERFEDPAEVRRAAQDWVRLINGLGRLLDASFRPIGTGNAFRRSADGKPGLLAYIVGTAEGRGKATATLVVKGGVPQPDPRVGRMARLLQASSTSDEAQRILYFLGRQELTWSDLYRAYEVVKRVGAGSALTAAGVSKAAIKRFQRTANSYAAIGIDSRHGVDRNTPPSTPMSFSEAREIIAQVLTAWLHERDPGGAAD